MGLVILGVAAYALYPSKAPEDADASLLFDRVWVDKQPEKQTDYVQAFYAIENQKAGIFANASTFDLHLERFDFKKGKGKLDVVFPQTGKKGEVAFTIKKCSEVPGFDLCLDIKSNPWGGPTRYYGAVDSDALKKQNPALAAELEAVRPR